MFEKLEDGKAQMITVLLFTKRFIIMKLRNYLLGMALLCTSAVFAGNATTVDHGNNKTTKKEEVAKMTKEQKDARIVELKVKEKELKSIDRSELTRSERKELRQDLRAVHQEQRHLGARTAAIAILGGAVVTAILLLALG